MAADLIISIGGNSKAYNDELKKVQKQTEALESQLKSIAVASGAAFAALTAIVGVSVKAFADFDYQLQGVKNRLDDTAFGTKGVQAGFAEMKKGLLGIAATFPIAIEDLNRALFDAAQSGMTAKDALKLVAASAKLATVGMTDAATATRGLEQIMNSFNLSADQAEIIASKFFAASKGGELTVADLSENLGKVATTAANAGVAIDDLFAAVTSASAAGLENKQIYAGLKQVLQGIAEPSTQAAAEAAKLGIAFNTAGIKTLGFSGFLDGVIKASGGSKDSLEKLFGSAEAVNVVMAIAGKNAGVFKDNLKALNNETETMNKFQKASQETLNTTGAKLTILQNQLKILAITLGAEFAPAMTKVVEATTKFLKVIADNPAMVKFIAYSIAIAAAITGTIAGLGALVLGIAALAEVFAVLNGVLVLTNVALLGLGIPALIALIVYLGYNWRTVWIEMQGVLFAFVKTVGPLMKSIGDLLTGIVVFDVSRIKQGWDDMKGAFAAGATGFKDEVARLRKEAHLEDLTETVKNGEEAGAKKREVAATQHKLTIDEQNALHDAAVTESRTKEEAERASDLEGILANDEKLSGVRAELSTKEYGDLQAQIKSTGQAQRESDSDKTKAHIDFLNKNKLTEARYGKEMAAIDAVIYSEKVAAFQSASGQMAQLTQSSNSTLKGIGKAFAISQIAIDTAQSASSIAKWISAAIPWPFSIPLIAAAVGARVAFGAEQAGRVLAANRGGLVPPNLGTPGRDSVPATLTPGELVVPAQSFEEVINAVARSRGGDEPLHGGGGEMGVTIGFEGRQASRVLSARRKQDQSLGIFVGA